MKSFIKRNKPTIMAMMAGLILSGMGLYQQATGHEIITRDQGLLVAALIFIGYLCSMVLTMTDDEITRTLGYRILPKHEFVTTTASAPTANPSLPGPQDPVGSFSNHVTEHPRRAYFAARGLGKSRLIETYINAMRHQHLTLVLDEADLQNTTRSKAEELGTSNVRVLTAARYRNVLLGNNRADHVVIAIKDFPEMLHGMMFASITVSPALEGKAPDWVALIKQTNEGKLAGTHCSYPHCHCPADHPGTEGWCLRGLPTGSL